MLLNLAPPGGGIQDIQATYIVTASIMLDSRAKKQKKTFALRCGSTSDPIAWQRESLYIGLMIFEMAIFFSFFTKISSNTLKFIVENS